ncbi:3-hydroxyacyl-CoA dehydrogenase, partial [Homarus americanus]
NLVYQLPLQLLISWFYSSRLQLYLQLFTLLVFGWQIVRISETSEDTYNAMKTFGKNMGKVSVLCKDNPGFIANRLVVPYLLSAVRMVERDWEKLFPDDQAFKVPPTLTKLVKEGKFGKKSGEGFYKYGN